MPSRIVEDSRIVKIGVSGHRSLGQMELIVIGIDRAVKKIADSFPGRSMAVLSSLAEGADRLVVYRVLNRERTRLIAILPLPKSDYLTDFGSEHSKREFLAFLRRAKKVIDLPPKATREEAYENAGEFIIKNCDVLIAIWDGQAEQGRGGTGEVVARARARKLPIAWVHAANRKLRNTYPAQMGPEEGIVTFERFQTLG